MARRPGTPLANSSSGPPQHRGRTSRARTVASARNRPDPGLAQELHELEQVERHILRTEQQIARFQWAIDHARRLGGRLTYVEKAIGIRLESLGDLKARRNVLLRTIAELKAEPDAD
jgi:hypothetical protein